MKTITKVFALFIASFVVVCLAACGKTTTAQSTRPTTTVGGSTTITEGTNTTVTQGSGTTSGTVTTTVGITTTVHSHSYTEEVTKAATCSEEGVKTFTCECGDSYTEPIEKLSHTEETIPAVTATCTATGLTEGKKCSVCQTVLVEQTVTEMIDHTIVAIGEAKEATYDEAGITAGKKCSVCQTVLEEQQVIPAKNALTVAEALTIINGLEAGKRDEVNKYRVTGYVLSGAFSSNKYTLIIADSMESTTTLRIANASFEAGLKFEIGQKVVADNGILAAYVASGSTTVEPRLQSSKIISASETGKTYNYGTLEAPLTVAEALENCKGFITPALEKTYVMGIVSRTDKQNVYIKGEGDAEFLVYLGNNFAVNDIPQVGQRILATGYFKVYYETLEMTVESIEVKHNYGEAKQSNAHVLDGYVEIVKTCSICGGTQVLQTVNLAQYNAGLHLTGANVGSANAYEWNRETMTLNVKAMTESVNQWANFTFSATQANVKYAYLVLEGSENMNVGAKFDADGNPYDGLSGNKVYKGLSGKTEVIVWDLEELKVDTTKIIKFVIWAYAVKGSGATTGTIKVLGAGLANTAEEISAIHNYKTYTSEGANGHSIACSCGAKKTEVHNLIDDARIEPTYEATGKEAGKHCDKCSYTEGGAVIPMLEKLTVTFDTQGGSPIEAQKVIPGTKASALASFVTTKTGYTFAGWYIGSVQVTPEMEVTENVTVTAHWTAIKYTVSFDNGVASQEVAYSEKAVKPEAPAKTDYIFVAWMNGETPFDFNTPITGNVSLTAYYKLAYTLVSTEAEFWAIYTNETTLGETYRLANDLTLSTNSCGRGENAYGINEVFTGTLDGQGHTLTWPGNRLFFQLKGTIKNITLNAGEGHYWGSAIAFDMNGATLEDVTLTATFNDNNCYIYAGGNFLGQSGSGLFAVWATNTTFKNVTGTMLLGPSATAAFYDAVAAHLSGCTFTNVEIGSNVELVASKDSQSSNSNDVVISVIDTRIAITTEEEWWAMYASEKTLAGSYKLMNDITLTKQGYAAAFVNGHELVFTFTGTIDGQGHTLTYTGNGLFTFFRGTLKNVTLNSGSGYYWASAFTFELDSATVENVNLTCEFTATETRWVHPAVGWIASPGQGAFGVYVKNTAFKNVVANVAVNGANAAAIGAIGYELTNCTFDNVEVKSVTELTPSITDKEAKTGLTITKIVPPDTRIAITTEEEFWAIYASDAALAGSYKLMNDITLTHTSCDRSENSYGINEIFTGTIDGQGHTLTWPGNRLFFQLKGTIKNITLNAGAGHYWGSAIAFDMNGATLEDVTLTATFNDNNCYIYAGGNFLGQTGSGLFAVWATNTTFTNVNGTILLGTNATTAFYDAVAAHLSGCTFTNVRIESNVELAVSKDSQSSNSNDVVVTLIDTRIAITNEDEWWAMYASEETLAGSYKLMNDITLTKQGYAAAFTNGHELVFTFTGSIDGQGHSLTYTGNGLFTFFKGTIKNVTINAGSGYYWASSFAFFMEDATVEGVTLNTEITTPETRWVAPGVGWMTSSGNGSFCVWATRVAFKNVTVNVTLSGTASAANTGALAYDLNACTCENVTVNSNAAVTPAITSTAALAGLTIKQNA